MKAHGDLAVLCKFRASQKAFDTGGARSSALQPATTRIKPYFVDEPLCILN